MGPRLRQKSCAPSSLEPLRNGSYPTRSCSSRKSRAPASASSRRLRCANSSQIGSGNSSAQLPACLAASRPFYDQSPPPRHTGIRSLPCNSVGTDESKDRTFTAPHLVLADGLQEEDLCQRFGSLRVLLEVSAVRSQKRCLRQEIAWSRRPEIRSNWPSLRASTVRTFVVSR